MLSRKTYAYTTGTLGTLQSTDSYGYYQQYETEMWGDVLKSYNGTTFSYDEIGNPLTYYNGANYTFEWIQGRTLISGTKGSTSFQYQYNTDGLRTRKIVGSTTYDYYWNGAQLAMMTITSGTNVTTLKFYYDAQGVPFYLDYNGTEYFYITNLQGDVVGIANSNGTVGYYEYDAWGRILTINSASSMEYSALTTNPLRYRGYIYDNETGFYYLQTRYYDPSIRRFINADGMMASTGSLQGYNLFAYCFNDPVNLSDGSGNWPNWTKLATGALRTVIGIGIAVAAVTAPVCAPMIAVAYAGIAAGGATFALVGMSEMDEAIDGSNPLKEVIGEENYALLDQTSTAIVGMGLPILEAGIQMGVCFVAGTLVQTESGSVPIEHVQVGMMVYAHDPDTGETALKEVVRTFVNEAKELVRVKMNGEEIVCTNEHPFYSPVKGWISACELRAGDILVTLNGEYVIVERVQHEILEAPITVYNFEVKDFHTYYVSDIAVLVHNTCKNTSSRGVGGKGWIGDKTWRENVSTVRNGGTITSLNGGIPSRSQAEQLISEAGGFIERIEGPHPYPNPHSYPHINYVTSAGVKATIQIFEE